MHKKRCSGLLLWVAVGCAHEQVTIPQERDKPVQATSAISPSDVVSSSSDSAVPLATDWSHTPITGELMDWIAIDKGLVAFAVEDAKATLGRRVTFYKAIRADDETIRYVFEIEHTDDSFLVYEKSSSTNKLSKKYLHNQLRL